MTGIGDGRTNVLKIVGRLELEMVETRCWRWFVEKKALCIIYCQCVDFPHTVTHLPIKCGHTYYHIRHFIYMNQCVGDGGGTGTGDGRTKLSEMVG